jgi:hypothetical protein
LRVGVPQIGKVKSLQAVTPIVRADYREQRAVFSEVQGRAIAERIPARQAASREHLDHAEQFVHLATSTIPGGDTNLDGINGNIYGENSFTAALSGLRADATYDVSVFVTRQNDPTDQKVTIAGAGTTSFSQIDSSTKQLIVNSMVGSSSEDLGFYALPIVSNGSGDITITVDSLETDGAAVSGIAIAAVPEPSTWAMLMVGLGGLGAVLRRRRVALAG